MDNKKHTIHGKVLRYDYDDDQPYYYIDNKDAPVFLGHGRKIDNGYVVKSGLGGFYIEKNEGGEE